MKKRVALSMLAASLCVAALCGLSACSAGQHQIVQASKGCDDAACHSEGKTTYEVADPKGATEVNTTFTVSTSASQVVVCTPMFTAQDGSSCTPVQKQAFNVSSGKAQVSVDEGVWAIATPGDGKSAYKIVKASNSCSNTELSL